MEARLAGDLEVRSLALLKRKMDTLREDQAAALREAELRAAHEAEQHAALVADSKRDLDDKLEKLQVDLRRTEARIRQREEGEGTERKLAEVNFQQAVEVRLRNFEGRPQSKSAG